MNTAFYNHEGKILYGVDWPEVPPVMASIYQDQAAVNKFNKQMNFLLRPDWHIVVSNPEKLPPIEKGEFLSAKDYGFFVEPDKNKCTIL